MTKIKYSIEQIIHFTCMGCNYRWTHNGMLPNWGFIHCPKCGEVFPPTQVEDTPYQPLVETLDDNELAKELEHRGYFVRYDPTK